ncbi:DUF1553 domain-containing protein [bacterium]|nr:DUF1553 domain-containing protein [bacterium]
MRRAAFFLASFCAGVLALTASPVRGADPVDFNAQIRPLLSDRCFFCHGPDEKHREAELRLDLPLDEDNRKYYLGDGSPDSSELLSRITTDDPRFRMPPEGSGKELSKNEIALIRRWVGEGAKWDTHWAYVAPVRHDPPAVKQADWPANWIDNFILHRLEHEELSPSPDADRVTLLRRVSFDLTGLPPTPQDVAAFVNDDSPNAWEKVVDRLLASEAHGERLAVYWLDLVRYADTVGYHGDQDHNASPYRDWVIDAFIDNLPFDRFTRDQLAGDLLEKSTTDDLIATAYNRLLQTSHEGGVQAKEYLAMYAADRVRNLGSVWLGATTGCCQCHNHKFDPYTMKDFYSLEAFFADIDEVQHLKKGTNNLPTERDPEIPVFTRRERAVLADLTAKIEQKQQQLATVGDSGNSQQKTELEQQVTELEEQKSQIEKSQRKVMITQAIEPRTIRVLPRGNWLDDSGAVVEPAIPEFLGSLNTGDRRATRLDLANWLTDAKNGAGLLTARVFANRFWYLMFGNGLARVLDDFGGQGEAPVHPQLLDRLAHEFVESGWNVRDVLKLIVMSRTYRQSSLEPEELKQRDPHNRLYARQSRFRLPAEMIRDNALAISGLLVRDIGGRSVKPYQPAGYYRHLNFPTRKYSPDTDEHQWRRGLYVHWQRQFLHPMLLAFDAPRREECTAQRPRSNTPLASLTLLNDPTFVEAARAFAQRILTDRGNDDASRLNFAFENAVSRAADAEERELLAALLASARNSFAKDEASATQLDSVGLSKGDSSLDGKELAAWTTVARAILNLNETNTRN